MSSDKIQRINERTILNESDALTGLGLVILLIAFWLGVYDIPLWQFSDY